MLVQAGDSEAIAGVIIGGADPKPIVFRGLGPSLSGVVSDVLADPVLEGLNDNWMDWCVSPLPTAPPCFPPPPGLEPSNELESLAFLPVDPGAHTAILGGNGNSVGVGLIEVYDLSPSASSKLLNLSTRAFVGTGDDIVIAGFILGGGSTDDVILLRGLGPSLSQSGVPNVLANPMLELRNSEGSLLASNDDWQNGPPVSLPPTDPLESEIQMTLSPGAYTALLSGVNHGTGVGLVEVYDLGAP
jgi:hypothetical protein